MKSKKGFTLVELLTIIILLGLITLIITPKITSILETQKLNVFRDSVEGIIKSVKEDAVNNAGFNSTTTENYRAYIYDDTGLYLTVAGKTATDSDIATSGKIKGGNGQIIITEDSDIALAIHNDKFCAIKNADDQDITVKKYDGSCSNDEINIPEAKSCYTTSTNSDNTLTITGYNYSDTDCSKNLVIPNRINGVKVTKLAPFAFVDADVKIAEYLENDASGNQDVYDEYYSNIPDGKKIQYIITTSTSNIKGKICYTAPNQSSSVEVDSNYVHTAGDGYYGCNFEFNKSSDADMTVNNYKFNSIDFSKATSVTEIPTALIFSSAVSSVNLGDYITKIGTMAFAFNYLSDIKINKNIKTIDNYAFEKNVLETVNFSSATSLEEINDGAFCQNNLSSLSFVDLPNLTFIGGGWWGAFEENNIQTLTLKNLPKLTALGSVEDEYGPFNYNDISLVVFDSLPKLELIGGNTFASNSLTTVSIPSSVKTIANTAFSDNEIDSLVLPDGLTSIGEESFYNNDLTTVSIPTSVKTIAAGAFKTNKITSLTLNEGLTSIGEEAFKNNDLTTVSIPSTVVSLGNQSFAIISGSSNANLTSIVNNTGLSFDWYDVLTQGTTETCSFITGTCNTTIVT